MAQSQAMPPFIFRIDELREHPKIQPARDKNGYWEPTTAARCNYVAPGGATNLWWLCDGQNIQVLHQGLPKGSVPHNTFSLFYSDGRGFWVLRGNATNPTYDEPWLPLCFEHDKKDNFSSYLTNARAEPALHCRREDQEWVSMLLPDIYHGSTVAENKQHGALKGELPILLGLLAFAIPMNSLQQYLPWMYHSGQWQLHSMGNGRTHKRGLVVEVYAYPYPNGGDNANAIEHRESGVTGKYYY